MGDARGASASPLRKGDGAARDVCLQVSNFLVKAL